MRKTHAPAVLGLCILMTGVVTLTGCGEKSGTTDIGYSAAPVFESELAITEGSDTLQPACLQLYDDSLYVSYLKMNRIDVFTTGLEKIRTINLNDPHIMQPTYFAVSDSEIIISDHARGLVAIYSLDGHYITSFGALPDLQTRLAPFALCSFDKILYLADINLNQVLAISIADIPGIMERGELVLSIPPDSSIQIGFPSAVFVTEDGRLLVGDGDLGKINVFTCDGRWIYEFDRVNTEKTPGLQAIALDDIIDPMLQDTSSFDPSGIRRMGRIHVADISNGQIHMFNPLGKYVSSYGRGRLENPAGIAIDKANRRVFIADPKIGRIVIFGYGE